MFFASLPPRSSDVIGFLELWALALHVTALVKLMMNQLFVQGLRDVSLSSCLITGQYRSLRRITVGRGWGATLTVIALSDPVLYPSTLSQI